MIRRPPRSTLSSSSAASDVYKRQVLLGGNCCDCPPGYATDLPCSLPVLPCACLNSKKETGTYLCSLYSNSLLGAWRLDLWTSVTLVEYVAGVQASLWTEMVRTSEQLDYMLFPRLLAVAERAWHEADWQSADSISQMKSRRRQDWEQFANTVGYRELKNLERSGVKYRLPPPGVR